jgi:hypothetical protein
MRNSCSLCPWLRINSNTKSVRHVVICTLYLLTERQTQIPAKNIAISTATSGNDEKYPIFVVLLVDVSSNACLISSRVLKERLGVDSWKAGSEHVFQALGVSLTTCGTITISWRFTNSSIRHTMECYIVDNDGASFDIIASRAYLNSNADLAQATGHHINSGKSSLLWRKRRKTSSKKVAAM